MLGWLGFVPVYFIAFWRWKGQTIGKMATHIKIVRTDGESIDLLTAILRFLAYMVSLLPLCAGFAVAAFNPDRRALHDFIANTVVVDLS